MNTSIVPATTRGAATPASERTTVAGQARPAALNFKTRSGAFVLRQPECVIAGCHEAGTREIAARSGGKPLGPFCLNHGLERLHALDYRGGARAIEVAS